MKKIPARTHETMKQNGVWVPSPLALGADRQVMEAWQRLLTLYYIRAGARTVIPGAHTGEFANNDLDLYDWWLGLVREMTHQYGEDMFLMAAAGGEQALQQAERAARHGYEVLMVAPTAYTDLSDDDAIELLREIASVIPVFGFELQRAIPGSRPISRRLWREMFEFAVGAKGASFDTYRSQIMLQAAAESPRRDELVMATGNDDRIVHDLGGLFPYMVDGEWVKMRYDVGLLGHFATDTASACNWARQVQQAAHAETPWTLPVSERELAHLVNVCNRVLFDALNDFENSVWGVKCRLSQLGLLPEPVCFEETGRPGMGERIKQAYDLHPLLNDDAFLDHELTEMKNEVGLPG